VQEEQLSSVVDWLTAQPRAAQLLDKDSSVVSTLEHQLGRYLKDVKRHYVKADKRLFPPWRPFSLNHRHLTSTLNPEKNLVHLASLY